MLALFLLLSMVIIAVVIGVPLTAALVCEKYYGLGNHESEVGRVEVEPSFSALEKSDWCIIKMEKGKDIKFKGELVFDEVVGEKRYRIWRSLSGDRWMGTWSDDLKRDYVAGASFGTVSTERMVEWLTMASKDVAHKIVKKYPELEKHLYRVIS